MQQTTINKNDLRRILSFIHQFNGMYTDTLLSSNTPDGFFGLVVFYIPSNDGKREEIQIKKKLLSDYQNSSALRQTQKIWVSGLVPIEIIQLSNVLVNLKGKNIPFPDGLATFYSLPQICFKYNHFIGFKLLYSEDRVPNLRDFF